MGFLQAFAQPALLGGLLLVGLPVLIHMIMRQKPRRLPFPAMRFLVQRIRSNQRKMQLRHLLLLGLRMLLIALACFALSRPRVHNERLNLATDQPRAVVLIVDTSPSMEYKVAGKTRLDEARRLAVELLDELPTGSRVAVLDTASPGGDWEAVTSARGRLSGLQPTAANYPVTSQLAHAYDLFARLKQDSNQASKGLLPFLFVFSDRTEASWDRNQVETLKRLRDRATEPVNAAYVDVGLDKAEDLSVTELQLKRQIVAPDEPVRATAVIRATNRPADLAIVFRIDDDVIDRKPVQLEAGQAKRLSFEHLVQTPGPHHVRVELEVADAALPFNDVAFATFEVQGGRRVLTITDDVKQVKDWSRAVAAWGFTSEVKPASDVADWTPQDLSPFAAIALVHVSPSGNVLHKLWELLDAYVQKGGGVIVVPGGTAMNNGDGLAAYNNDNVARKLLPGTFKRSVFSDKKEGTLLDWQRVRYEHPVFAPFREWFGKGYFPDYQNAVLGPRAFRYWEVQPDAERSNTLMFLAGNDRWPLLLERQFDAREKIRGRVLLLTVPMDDRHDGRADLPGRWQNFLAVEPSFYNVLVKQAVGYLAGDDREETLNFQCGQTVTIPVPATPRLPQYVVQGPGLAGGAESTVSRQEGENEIRIPQATQRGNFTVFGPQGERVAGFSLNDAPEESQLVPRIAKEPIEALLGADCILEVESGSSLRQALEHRWSQPVELFPLLMILLLLALAVENLLANKFYRQQTQEEPAGVVKVPEPAAAEKQETVSAS